MHLTDTPSRYYLRSWFYICQVVLVSCILVSLHFTLVSEQFNDDDSDDSVTATSSHHRTPSHNPHHTHHTHHTTPSHHSHNVVGALSSEGQSSARSHSHMHTHSFLISHDEYFGSNVHYLLVISATLMVPYLCNLLYDIVIEYLLPNLSQFVPSEASALSRRRRASSTENHTLASPQTKKASPKHAPHDAPVQNNENNNNNKSRANSASNVLTHSAISVHANDSLSTAHHDRPTGVDGAPSQKPPQVDHERTLKHWLFRDQAFLATATQVTMLLAILLPNVLLINLEFSLRSEEFGGVFWLIVHLQMLVVFNASIFYVLNTLHRFFSTPWIVVLVFCSSVLSLLHFLSPLFPADVLPVEEGAAGVREGYQRWTIACRLLMLLVSLCSFLILHVHCVLVFFRGFCLSRWNNNNNNDTNNNIGNGDVENNDNRYGGIRRFLSQRNNNRTNNYLVGNNNENNNNNANNTTPAQREQNKTAPATPQSLSLEEKTCAFFLVCLVLWFFILTAMHALVFARMIDAEDYSPVIVGFLSSLVILYGLVHMGKNKNQAIDAHNALERKRIFVRHVSHEIRTPLNTAILGLKLLEQELQTVNTLYQRIRHAHHHTHHTAQYESDEESDEDDTPHQLTELVSDVNVSCTIAVDILNDLLLYEKIDGGLLALEMREIPLWECVVEVLKMFRILARSAKINFSWPEKCVPDCAVLADRNKFSQVLRNLVSNALKFTQETGSVHVSAQILTHSDEILSSPKAAKAMRSRRISDTVFPGRDVVRINVKDTGPGISIDDQTRLFHEIVQFDADKLQQGKGSGLGLWISNKIMALHGGQIGVYSDGEGHGSTFYVDLPLVRRTKPPPPTHTPHTHTQTNLTQTNTHSLCPDPEAAVSGNDACSSSVSVSVGANDERRYSTHTEAEARRREELFGMISLEEGHARGIQAPSNLCECFVVRESETDGVCGACGKPSGGRKRPQLTVHIPSQSSSSERRTHTSFSSHVFPSFSLSEDCDGLATTHSSFTQSLFPSVVTAARERACERACESVFEKVSQSVEREGTDNEEFVLYNTSSDAHTPTHTHTFTHTQSLSPPHTFTQTQTQSTPRVLNRPRSVSADSVLNEPSLLMTKQPSRRSQHSHTRGSPTFAQTQAQAQAQALAVIADKRVLIVDDSKTNRRIVSRLLRDRVRYRVEAEDGLRAIEIVREGMLLTHNSNNNNNNNNNNNDDDNNNTLSDAESAQNNNTHTHLHTSSADPHSSRTARLSYAPPAQTPHSTSSHSTYNLTAQQAAEETTQRSAPSTHRSPTHGGNRRRTSSSDASHTSDTHSKTLGPVDVVVLDYSMPRMDGPQTARALRELSFRGLIVGVTGNAHEEYVTCFKDSGADHVLTKPLDMDKFWKILIDAFTPV